ncbi:MAG TPA: DUF5343 domain-containing protein [Verrucomicrobiae bacterium]|nr:DUF5343 domain-containing protein [Verrucomicrobiae bacterium]
MTTKLPYVVQPGSIKKILEKVRDAKTPDRFTTDFLDTKLGFRGGNFRQFIPLAKKLNLLNSDGTPTDLYKAFRNPTTAKASIAEAIKAGYRELFDRNEYAGSLSKEELKGLVVQVTGLDAKDQVVGLICRTFEMLRSLADFEQRLSPALSEETTEAAGEKEPSSRNGGQDREVDLRLSYTINLVLPKTDDPAVFNAIFKALREHLLRK